MDHEARKTRVLAECEALAAPLLGAGVPGVSVSIGASQYGHQPFGVTV